MNIESPDELDRLLSDWAASRTADARHTSRLSNQILAAVRDESDVGRNKSAQFRHDPDVRPLPERRNALFRPTATAEWGARLMIGGGLLLFLILAGGLLYINSSTVPPGNPQPGGPIAASPDTSPPGASLGAAVLAAKRQLLTETNALFDDRLAWIADGGREVSFEVREQAAQDEGEFMLVRVIVAQRSSPDSPWATVWQADVISRSEALVDVTPKQLDGSSLALWTYLMSDGQVAVEMDLTLDQETKVQSHSSTVLQTGQPTRVGCSTEDGVEQCIFQTVMPLSSSKI